MPRFAYDIPHNYYFGGGTGSCGTPLGIAILLGAAILIIVLRREYVIVPFVLASLLTPLDNNMTVVGLNFNALRLLLVAAWVRVLVRRERYHGPLNYLDRVVLAGTLVNAVCFSLVWGKAGALVNRSGFVFNALGTYFLFRALICDKADILRLIKVFAVAVIVLAPLLWYEHISFHNPFSLLGAPDTVYIRENIVRARGPFAHAIIAGTFSVVLIPLFVGLWWHGRRYRIIAALGIAASLVMMFASHSSTPVLTVPAVVLALCMWPARRKMRTVRRGIVAMLVAMQLAMHNPIWHVLATLGRVLGGSGWHRSELINNFVLHFPQWWLIGTNRNDLWGWSMWDVDNAYVGAGLMGGFLGFVLFVAIFVYGYKMIGKARALTDGSGSDERLVWAIGSALFANSVAFLGIVYFDQSQIAWYALLVIISVMHEWVVEQRCAQPMSDGMAFVPGLQPAPLSRVSLAFQSVRLPWKHL